MEVKNKAQYISVDLLSTHPENPRKIDEKQLNILCESIKSNGDYFEARPILCNTKYVIFAGNMRYLAAKKIGLTEVPVIIMDVTPEKEREYMIRDNRQNGQWDMDSLANNFDVEELLHWGFEEGELTGWYKDFGEMYDEVPDIGEITEPQSKRGEVYQLGPHRLMCGDSTSAEDVAILMDGKKADMVFTDPPYGVSYAEKNEYLNTISRGNRIQVPIENDHKNIEELQDEIIYPAFCNIRESLAERSSYYITAPQGGDLLMMMMMMMMKSGLTLRHMIIWAKNNHVLGRTDYNYKHEPILYGWVKVHDFYGEGPYRFSTWEIPKPTKSDLHPTMKPVELIINAILNSSRKENIILDTFLGSGSTLIAAEKTGRICYGMEIDCKYIDVIIERWCRFTGSYNIIKNGESFIWKTKQ